MEPCKKAMQLVLRSFRSVERCRVPTAWECVASEGCSSMRSDDADNRSSPLTAMHSNIFWQSNVPSPSGIGILRLKGRPSALSLASPYTGGAYQLRHMSWRRHLPSLDGFRRAAEDSNRQVTNLLLAINVATYALAKFDKSVATKLVLIPYAVARGDWYRLLTSGFLHLDFLHLLSNMLSVHWLGPGLEAATGRGRFAAIYLSSTLAGSWAQYQFGSLATASLGASGGVFGLFGAYLVWRVRNRNFIAWDAEDTSWLAQVVGMNVLVGVVAGSHISQLAHFGGALTGAAMCWLIGPRYRWDHGRLVDRPLLPLFRTQK